NAPPAAAEPAAAATESRAWSGCPLVATSGPQGSPGGGLRISPQARPLVATTNRTALGRSEARRMAPGDGGFLHARPSALVSRPGRRRHVVADEDSRPRAHRDRPAPLQETPG